MSSARMIASDCCALRHQQIRNGLVVRSSAASRSEGMILLLVLIVLGMLSLAAYSFSESMVTENRALRNGGDQIRLQAAAASGVEALVASWKRNVPDTAVTAETANRGERIDWEQLIASEIAWQDSLGDRYSVAIHAGGSGTELADVWGPFDESGKLDLTSIALDEESAVYARLRLMQIPNMTPQIADAILDWMDEDEFPREFGAESNWYGSRGLGYSPRQGKIESLRELLLVRGVTMELLFGEDENGSGWLDASENDGAATLPTDNADGKLQRGWSRWLTIYSAESNLDASGRLKVCINQDSLVTLFRELEPLVGRDAARFIVAMRMTGPINNENVARFDSQEAIEERRATAAARSRQQREGMKVFGNAQREIINGFEIGMAGNYVIRSMVDLIDRMTEARIDGQQQILESPWRNDPQSIAATLQLLESQMTTQPGPRMHGRINLNTAEREVLMTIPGMTSDIVTNLLQRRGGARLTRQACHGAGWLYQQGIVDLTKLRKIAPYTTDSGDVFSGVAVGSVQGCRQMAAASFLIDGTGIAPEILRLEYHGPASSNIVRSIAEAPSP